MMKLDAITLEFARQVIEEETGAPLEIQAARVVPAGNGSGYLNEVSPLTVRTGPGEDRKA